MTTSLTIRMDETLKREAEALFNDFGMNLTTAITCFFKKALSIEAMPFAIGRNSVNARLRAALEEAKQVSNDPNAPACTDANRLEDFLLS